MPFLIGIHSSLMERVRKMPLDDIVILDVDANTVEKPEHFDDVEQLPPRVVRRDEVTFLRHFFFEWLAQRKGIREIKLGLHYFF